MPNILPPFACVRNRTYATPFARVARAVVRAFTTLSCEDLAQRRDQRIHIAALNYRHTLAFAQSAGRRRDHRHAARESREQMARTFLDECRLHDDTDIAEPRIWSALACAPRLDARPKIGALQIAAQE